MEMATLVTLESLLDGSSGNSYNRVGATADDEIIQALDILTVFESICIIEHNLIAYESALDIEYMESDIAYENEDYISPNIITLEAGIADGLKSMLDKIATFFKNIWTFISTQIGKIIDFFKGLGKKKGKKTPAQEKAEATLVNSDPEKANEIVSQAASSSSSSGSSSSSSGSDDDDTSSSQPSVSNDEPKASIKYPSVRKYAYNPEAVVSALLTDAEPFIQEFEEIVCTMEHSVDNFDAVKKHVEDLLNKSNIFDIKTVQHGREDTTYRFLGSGEWSDAFDKEVFPNGTEKQEISCKDAHITPMTFKYFNENRFQSQLLSLKSKMNSASIKCNAALKTLQKEVQSSADNVHSSSVNAHKQKYLSTIHSKQYKRVDTVGRTIMKNKFMADKDDIDASHDTATNTINQSVKRISAIFMSALPLINCVWSKIYSIANEMRMVDAQITKMATVIAK
jgi:hypothetical protein